MKAWYTTECVIAVSSSIGTVSNVFSRRFGSKFRCFSLVSSPVVVTVRNNLLLRDQVKLRTDKNMRTTGMERVIQLMEIHSRMRVYALPSRSFKMCEGKSCGTFEATSINKCHDRIKLYWIVQEILIIQTALLNRYLKNIYLRILQITFIKFRIIPSAPVQITKTLRQKNSGWSSTIFHYDNVPNTHWRLPINNRLS